MTRLKNSAMARNKKLSVPVTKEVAALAQVLKKLGYLDEVKKAGEALEITLTYKNKRPVITNIKLISKPGLRVYKDISEIEAKRGPSVLIISTSKGILSSREAIKTRNGGEVIAEVW